VPKVRITATATVEYCQVREIPDEALAAYTAAVDRNEHYHWFSDFIDRYLDSADVCDAGSYEDVEVTLVHPAD